MDVGEPRDVVQGGHRRARLAGGDPDVRSGPELAGGVEAVGPRTRVRRRATSVAAAIATASTGAVTGTSRRDRCRAAKSRVTSSPPDRRSTRAATGGNSVSATRTTATSRAAGAATATGSTAGVPSAPTVTGEP